MTISVLMVAEKPSICTSIANALARDQHMETRGRSPPVHEFHHTFMGKPALIKVTSVTGHVFSTDFPKQYQNWDAVDPVELFTAPVLHAPEGKGGMVKHLEREARGMDYLVLWLDCDREGENICFEVIKCVQNSMKQPQSYINPQSNYNKHHRSLPQTIFRARFSAVTPKDIEKAMNQLVEPNENEALAVDARQELDLKVGVAFSRYQTRYFQGKYGNLDSAIISYGPCQTPTLGFCVERYDEIQSFRSKPYYCLDLTIEINGRMLAIDSDRGRIFEKYICDNLVQKFTTSSSNHTEKTLVCTDIKVTESRKTRPTPLNTVELLKLASKNLGIGPQSAMRAAEHLYLSGYLSYPRTESTAYPSSFDFEEVLQQQKAHPEWGGYSSGLLRKGYSAPRQGHDAGDHPPITPVGLALPHELVSSDNQRIYELVCRHFLATISADAVFQCTRAKFTSETATTSSASTSTTATTGSNSGSGKEVFTARGKRELHAGFLQVYRTCVGTQQQSTVDDEEVGEESAGDDRDSRHAGWSGLVELPVLEVGQRYRVAAAKARQGMTRPPGFLTESDLIGRMEKHGIGTDASIPTHITNITTRNYVTLGPGRTLIPTDLGIVLVHGYQRIDPHLVLPDTRAAIEASCDRIAKGIASKSTVLAQALTAFQSKFEHFRTHIGLMDSLFEASFSPLAATGKNMSKCGRCLRYMRYIPMRPQRLYCPTCQETYNLPQNGTVKLYKELRCPLDSFELVLFSLGNTAKAQGKSYPLCPCCYNQPPVFLNEAEIAALKATSKTSECVDSVPVRVTSCMKSSAVEAINQSLQSLKVSGLEEPVVDDLEVLGIEEHKGVFIRRRVKEGAKVTVGKAVGTGVVTITDIPVPDPATPVLSQSGRGESTVPPPPVSVPPALPTPPGLPHTQQDEGGRGGDRGGRGRGGGRNQSGRGGRGGRRGRGGRGDSAHNDHVVDAPALPVVVRTSTSVIPAAAVDAGSQATIAVGGGRRGRGYKARLDAAAAASGVPRHQYTESASAIADTSQVPHMPPTPPLPIVPTATATMVPSTTTTSTTADPPREIEEVESMGCNSCMHPTCPHSAALNMICECPGETALGEPCPGSLILDQNSKPNWKLACNQARCNTLIKFRADIHSIKPQPTVPCPECGIRTAIFEFNKLRSPLPNGATTHIGCVLCDEFLNNLTEVTTGRSVNLLVARQERHRRGAFGRGRGRGRRGGRGGRHGDVKMSFSEF